MSSVARRSEAMPSRTTSWSSTSSTRSSGVMMSMVASSADRLNLRSVVNIGLLDQAGGDTIQEVLHRGLRDAVEQGTVGDPADRPSGRTVPSGQREMGSRGAERRHLDVRLQ